MKSATTELTSIVNQTKITLHAALNELIERDEELTVAVQEFSNQRAKVWANLNKAINEYNTVANETNGLLVEVRTTDTSKVFDVEVDTVTFETPEIVIDLPNTAIGVTALNHLETQDGITHS